MTSKSKDEEHYDVLMKSDDLKPANFEEAIKATGFGKFNILLMCIAIPCSFAQIIEQTSISFVLPIAQCDLNLSLKDKGILNSMGYTGMILCGFIWGYICDTYGRRKVVMYGYLFNSFAYLLASLAQTFPMLLFAKFCSGIMFTGPYSAFASYMSEFHASSRRAKVQLIRGMASSLAVIILPLIGWIVLPNRWKFFLSENIAIHSWNIFLVICSLPALTASIIFMFVPESPKFLMTKGRNEEALQVFQLIHRINTGRSNSYPIKVLITDENNSVIDKNGKKMEPKQTTKGWQSLKPLFCRPYFFTLCHVCINIMALIAGVYGLKMWYPQLLQSINDYEQTNGKDDISICNVIESMTIRRTNSTVRNCTVNLDNSSVYVNATILGAANMFFFIVAGIVVNKLGKKTLVVIFATLAATCPLLMYFISNSTVMLTLFPLILALGETCGNILVTIIMELFPTAFRITALNICLTLLRVGVALTNIIFPYLLMSGCLAVLSYISMCIFISVFLTSISPSTENKALE